MGIIDYLDDVFNDEVIEGINSEYVLQYLVYKEMKKLENKLDLDKNSIQDIMIAKAFSETLKEYSNRFDNREWQSAKLSKFSDDFMKLNSEYYNPSFNTDSTVLSYEENKQFLNYHKLVIEDKNNLSFKEMKYHQKDKDEKNKIYKETNNVSLYDVEESIDKLTRLTNNTILDVALQEVKKKLQELKKNKSYKRIINKLNKVNEDKIKLIFVTDKETDTKIINKNDLYEKLSNKEQKDITKFYNDIADKIKLDKLNKIEVKEYIKRVESEEFRTRIEDTYLMIQNAELNRLQNQFIESNDMYSNNETVIDSINYFQEKYNIDHLQSYSAIDRDFMEEYYEIENDFSKIEEVLKDNLSDRNKLDDTIDMFIENQISDKLNNISNYKEPEFLTELKIENNTYREHILDYQKPANTSSQSREFEKAQKLFSDFKIKNEVINNLALKREDVNELTQLKSELGNNKNIASETHEVLKNGLKAIIKDEAILNNYNHGELHQLVKEIEKNPKSYVKNMKAAKPVLDCLSTQSVNEKMNSAIESENSLKEKLDNKINEIKNQNIDFCKLDKNQGEIENYLNDPKRYLTDFQKIEKNIIKTKENNPDIFNEITKELNLDSEALINKITSETTKTKKEETINKKGITK